MKLQNKLLTAVWVALILNIIVNFPARAQQYTKTFRVGFLSGGFPGSNLGYTPIRRELRELGYVEGKNITFEPRYAEDTLERSRSLAEELVQLNVDLIIAGGTGDTEWARRATAKIPIVFLESVSDPVEQGFVESLARPGKNITGFTTGAWIMAGKRLDLLKEVLPNLSRVGVLWDPQAPGNAPQWKESQKAAGQLGLQLHSMEVSNSGRYESAFTVAVKAGTAAIAVTSHRLSNAYRKRIVELATKHRLPGIYPRANYVEDGGLISYGADEVEPYRRAASIIDKILKGAKPADVPVEVSRNFDLAINLKTAKQIGLTIPPRVLARADRVIK